MHHQRDSTGQQSPYQSRSLMRDGRLGMTSTMRSKPWGQLPEAPLSIFGSCEPSERLALSQVFGKPLF